MKISFPKYGPGELLIRKIDAPSIIWSMMIGFFAGLCGSYLLKNHFWLLMIAALSVVSILLFLGAAVGSFLNWRKVDEAPGASIQENGPRIASQWDYRPRKAIRADAVFDSPSAETSEVLSPDAFGISNKAWFDNDSALEGAAPAFVNIRPDAEELMTKVLAETTDAVCAAPAAEDAAVSRYD
jgi:hypothetical protein